MDPVSFRQLWMKQYGREMGECMLQERYDQVAMVNQWSFAAHVDENEGSAGCERRR